MKNPRSLFLLIIVLTIIGIFINLPNTISFQDFKKDIKYNPNLLVSKLMPGKEITFRQGLDLKGGVSLTFKAAVEEVPASERDQALESARSVIERRVNLFGVSEPLIQTAKVNKDSRIIVELPGVSNVNEAINLIGQTAKLTFWEQTATISGTIPSDYPLNAGELGALSKTDLSGSDLSQASVVFDPNTGK